MEQTVRRDDNKSHCLRRISSVITDGLETAFFHVGHFVGKYPILTVVLSFVICGLCGIGLKTFSETDEQEKLWVPQSSRLIKEKLWVDKVFPDETRYVSMVMESKTSVLTPRFLKAVMDYYILSERIAASGLTFSDFCVKVGSQCSVSSLLELWNYNLTAISSLTRIEVVNTVNRVAVSPTLGYDISTLLGGKITRSAGKIMWASATQITWVTSGHLEEVKEWESKMIEIARDGHPDISNTYIFTSRSFDDEGYGAVDRDINLLTAGFSIVFVFVMLSLGKFNFVEQKIYVSLAGMMCVGLSLVVAYGLATAMNLIYSPIQSIMPFLLLGIGVDDMFVVVEVWKNLSPEESELSVPDKMATTLKRAGVSITVTSVTDAVAFGVGASTVIPALSAFCVYAVLGIFALFVLVITFFSACLCLDERRRRRGLDACIICYRHRDYTPNACSQGSSLMQLFFSKLYGPTLMKLPVKIGVIVVTLGIFAVNVWSFTMLKQEFKLSSYIPSDSYAYEFMDAKEKLFREEGVDTAVYCGHFSYFRYRPQLEGMYRSIIIDPYVQSGTVNAWFMHHYHWLNQTGREVKTEQQYIDSLKAYFSTAGVSMARFVIFSDDANPTAIQGSYITLRHVLQHDSARDIKAMESLRAIVDGSGLPLYQDDDNLPARQCFAYSQKYMTYETNKVLKDELYRNLVLAGVSVLVVTCVLIANLWTSSLVFFCVIFTVVDVAGVLQFWGTSIDTASSILLTLTVGLAVDYSAHIAHTFMTISGPRPERTIATLRNIGSAVFSGGFSTFLAFVLLANSSSYGFVVFFRVFFTVVLFGLFHGLAFLPVMLSIVGPPAYQHADIIAKSHQLSVRREPTSEPNAVDEISCPGTKDSGDAANAKVQQPSGDGSAYRTPFTVCDSLGDGVMFTPRGSTIYLPPPDY